ncbi:hypothetical protein COO60DRAFT_1623453 [Scenedesmus sp. NREL 46B-D3]|nr:hypothetical protein COO60DRAFT_1623453 [Scenedesmus sp. NREL 46B-D3]
MLLYRWSSRSSPSLPWGTLLRHGSMLRVLTASSRLAGSSKLQQVVMGLRIDGLQGHPALQEACQLFTNSSSAQKQQQKEGKQQQQGSRQAREAQSRLIQFEYKSPTLTAQLPDHTTAPLPLLQAGVLPHPVKTAKHVWHMGVNKVFMWIALAAARKNIPGYNDWGDAGLQQQFASMYTRINEAQASFTLDRIKDLVSRDMFLKLRAQAEQRRMGHWDKIVWRIENEDDLHDPRTKSLKLVEGRMVRLTKDSPFEWLRLTYCIRSKQRFAAYRVQKGQRDELVAGNPDEVIDVEDYWMFEHKTRTPVNNEKIPVEGARWRLVKRQARQ